MTAATEWIVSYRVSNGPFYAPDDYWWFSAASDSGQIHFIAMRHISEGRIPTGFHWETRFPISQRSLWASHLTDFAMYSDRMAKGTDWIAETSHWFVVFCTALLPSIWLLKRKRAQARPGICENCGYDLRATPDRCPECGTVSVKP